ncbi:MAG: PAS domain S-box protein [Bdellovibrionales bacterium]
MEARSLEIAPNFRALFESAPGLYLVISTVFIICAVTDRYLQATMTVREEIIGRHLFDVFPDNPDDPQADGVNNLRDSLNRVLTHKAPHTMRLQKYDIRRPHSLGGGFEERFWSPVNSPVLDESGNILYIIHRVEDVTEFVKLQKLETEQKKISTELETRACQMEVEIHRRSLERQRLDKELELQSLIMSNMAEGVCMVRASDGLIVFANPKFEAMFGYASGELRGKSAQLLSADRADASAEQVSTEIQTAIRRNGTYTYEVLNKKKDGSAIWCRATTSQFEHPEHGMVFVSVHADITRSKRLTEERQSLEEKLERFFTASLDMLCIAGIDGYFKRMNPVWQKVLGFTSDELCSKPFVEFVHPDDREPTLRAIERQKGGGAVISFENRYLCKDGTYRWLSWKSIPVQNEIYAAARDVTQEKFVEHELRQALKTATLYSSALDSSAVVAFTDPGGTITHVNDFFCELSGYGRSELIGQNHRILNSGTHPKEFFIHLWKTISAGKIWRGEICNRTKSGELFWLDTTIVPSLDETGRVEQYMSVRFDVTQRKRAELKLIHSAKMSSLGEMAGGIAHEINTPLAIIQAKSDQLVMRLETGDFDREIFIKELIKIMNTTDRVAKIIKGLRTFSRSSESDPMDTVPVSQILDDTPELCLEKFRHRSIEFRIPDFGDRKIECRPAQISQVLLNLLNNSYDAVRELNEKWIEIIIESSADRIKIVVTDSGQGIPTDLHERIMQPFFTTKEVGSGTGLGLSISKGIVEDHHGRLYLDSSKKNTCFVLELPLFQPMTERSAA